MTQSRHDLLRCTCLLSRVKQTSQAVFRLAKNIGKFTAYSAEPPPRPTIIGAIEKEASMKTLIRNVLLGAAGLVALSLQAHAVGLATVADAPLVKPNTAQQQFAQHDPSAGSNGFQTKKWEEKTTTQQQSAPKTKTKIKRTTQQQAVPKTKKTTQ